MPEYFGESMELDFNSQDITDLRRVAINEEAAERKKADGTTAGDTEEVTVESSVGGAVTTIIEVEILDQTGATHPIKTMALNTQASLVFYPEGNASGNPSITATSATLMSRNSEYPARDLCVIRCRFKSEAAATPGTVA